jgi:hypothetical protein
MTEESEKINWNKSVSDEEFEEIMRFNNDEISIDDVDFDSVNPRDIIDAVAGKDFARD